MGRALIILAAAAALLSAHHQYTASRNVVDARRSLAESEKRALARLVAHSGYARGRIEALETVLLSPTVTSTEVDGEYLGGGYVVTVEETTDAVTGENTVLVSATGHFDPFTHRIEARFEEDVPAFMKQALYSSGSVWVEKDAKIHSLDSTRNANVHADETLDLAMEDGGEITGFATHAGPFYGDDSYVEPNVNPDGEDPVHQAEEQDAPQVDFADLQSRTDTTLGSSTWTGSPIPLALSGDASNPTVLYRNGDLDLTADVLVSGYGVLVVDGDFQVDGGSILYQDGIPAGLTVVVRGEFDAEGVSDLRGQYVAQGDVSLDPNVTIRGSLANVGGAQGGDVTVDGAEIQYDPAGADLMKSVWPDQMTLTLLEQTEW